MHTDEAFNEMSAELTDIAAKGERLLLNGRLSLQRGVRDQPLAALLLACTIGYLVGWTASRI